MAIDLKTFKYTSDNILTPNVIQYATIVFDKPKMAKLFV